MLDDQQSQSKISSNQNKKRRNSAISSNVSVKEKFQNVGNTLGMIQDEIRFDNQLRDKVSKKDKKILQKAEDSPFIVTVRLIKYFLIFIFVFGCPIF